METSALLTLGRLRGLQVGAILNVVVRYGDDVQDGVSSYINADDTMMAGEQWAITSAFNALVAT